MGDPKETKTDIKEMLIAGPESAATAESGRAGLGPGQMYAAAARRRNGTGHSE
jgi:hypothetical protein